MAGCSDVVWLGRAFQREGAATEKALSPQVRSLFLVVFSLVASVDLRHRVGVWWYWRSSERQGGARLFMTRW